MADTVVALEDLVRGALEEFAHGLEPQTWVGKEHDCVNRFAHGHLVPQCREGTPLFHPTQIGIEVGVAQPPAVGKKAAARKDLVIWPGPWMSCFDASWHPVYQPAMVMEWKALRSGFRAGSTDHDHKWLSAYTAWQPGAIGLSVVVAIGPAKRRRLSAARFHQGVVTVDWLVVG